MASSKLRVPSSTGKRPRIDANQPIRLIRHSSQTASLKQGDVIQIYGHHIVWDEHCVSEDVVIQWRMEGDPLCDAALVHLLSDTTPVGMDMYDRLQTFVTKLDAHDNASPAITFWRSITEIPPNDIRVTDDQFERGRALFLDHSIQISQSLLYFSLAGGFASPRIVRTLEAVSYLLPSSPGPASPASNDRIYRRLMETFQFVLDVMRCCAPESDAKGASHLLPGGEGWKSMVRVRMLHGVARARVKAKTHRTPDDPRVNDVPISQEDMSATLASFSTVSLWTLTALGLTPTREDAQAFLAIWKHVGFYMGVSPIILRRYFCDVDVSDKFLASIIIHLFSPDDEDDISFHAPTMPILIATTGRPPLRNTLEWNCAVTHRLLGYELATYLKVPEPAWSMKLKTEAVLALQSVPVLFSRVYGRSFRRGWLEKRRWVYAVGMILTLRGTLGMRRTKFRPGGEEQPKWDDEKVKADPELTRKARIVFREVIAEMMAILIWIGAMGLCLDRWRTVYKDPVRVWNLSESEPTMLSTFSLAVLCLNILGQMVTGAAFEPANPVFLAARQKDDDSTGAFTTHLQTMGLPYPPAELDTESAQPLPTTFTIARVESHTTVYEVQTTTLYPFAHAAASATSTPTPSPTPTNRSTQAELSDKKLIFWLAGGICGVVLFLAAILIVYVGARRKVRRNDRLAESGVEGQASNGTKAGLKVEARTPDKPILFGVANGKIWMDQPVQRHSEEEDR
ncbi:hypothetical protein V5O48_011453 [Marasmius crinis-equi]|uniref:ER-bound oxygenase mpaB/mpaB'/Rubber oxygenase catalytic domain-containing protein n=1 Tax=Marasmius crinis-equi TaxID=585013 RepID=A0ABR3F5I3_9AGAR